MFNKRCFCRGSGFVSLFQMLKNGQEVEKIKSIYSEENLSVYYSAKEKVKMAIATAFGLDEDLLHLTQPTFFSRLTGQKAKSAHDEYWHSHIDSNQYPHFDYTALVYLNNHRKWGHISVTLGSFHQRQMIVWKPLFMPTIFQRRKHQGVKLKSILR